MKIGYSDTYNTSTSQYRYNYNSSQLEKLGKKISILCSKGTTYPVVETGVIECYSIDPKKFDKSPMYWVLLYEDAKKRKKI